MRHNPREPDWLDRDRFVLSAGHASMLLYSTLYLSGYPTDARRHRALPPARLAHRRATPSAGTRPGSRRRPARSARGSRWRSASRSPSACSPRASTSAGHEVVDHYTFVIASDGDIQEGISSEASLARGPPRARQADRLLRRQQDPARQPDGARLLRGRRRALRGLRLAREERRRGHLARAARGARSRRAMEVDRPPLADHLPHAHRLRQPEQAGHGQGARLGARRGRGPAHQGGLRLGPRQALLRARRGARALPRSACERGAGTRRSGTSASTPIARRVPRHGRAELEQFNERRGCPPAGIALPSRGSTPDDKPLATRKAPRQVIQWAAAEVPRAGRRLRRPRALQRTPTSTAAATSSPATLRRSQPPLRRARARRWARSSTASTLHGFRAYGATFLTFSRLHARRRAARRR